MRITQSDKDIVTLLIMYFFTVLFIDEYFAWLNRRDEKKKLKDEQCRSQSIVEKMNSY